MKKYILHSALLFTLILSSVCVTNAQSVDEAITNLSSDAAKKYINPVASALGSNMSSGWFSGLPQKSLLGFHATLRFVGVGSIFVEKERNFSTVSEFHLTSTQADEILSASGIDPMLYLAAKEELLSRDWPLTIQGPTITGSREENVQIIFPSTEILGGQVSVNEYSFSLEDVKGYLDGFPMLPSAAIQLDLSGFIGTGISIRYLPAVEFNSMGKMKIFGGGITHNLSYWFADSFPVDLGFAVYFQDFELGDVFQNVTAQSGFYISKRIGGAVALLPYAGITVESSTTHIKYKYNFDTPAGTQDGNISLSIGGANDVGYVFGSTLIFPVLSVNFDLKFSHTTTGSIGVGFGF